MLRPAPGALDQGVNRLACSAPANPIGYFLFPRLVASALRRNCLTASQMR